jgi:hypothetical protein
MSTHDMHMIVIDWNERGQQTPRAVIHKHILDIAEDRPNDSMEGLASEIAGDSTELGEDVFDQYGDPHEAKSASDEPQPSDTSASADSTSEPVDEESEDVDRPIWEDLTEKQQETLRAIRTRLSATQADVGDVLGVSGATISTRLSGIPGFDWDERRAFVDEVVSPKVVGDGHGQTAVESPSNLEPRLDTLEDRQDALESRSTDEGLSAELAHKIVPACVASDAISVDEELEVITVLIES